MYSYEYDKGHKKWLLCEGGKPNRLLDNLALLYEIHEGDRSGILIKHGELDLVQAYKKKVDVVYNDPAFSNCELHLVSDLNPALEEDINCCIDTTGFIYHFHKKYFNISKFWVKKTEI